MNLVSMIYQISNTFPSRELFGITNQLRRAAVSIPSNIAEGASRNSVNERRRFFYIARSSLVEIDTQIEISKSLEFLSTDSLNQLSKELNKLFAMMTKLIQRTNS